MALVAFFASVCSSSQILGVACSATIKSTLRRSSGVRLLLSFR